jgi:hypothetical protein
MPESAERKSALCHPSFATVNFGISPQRHRDTETDLIDVGAFLVDALPGFKVEPGGP